MIEKLHNKREPEEIIVRTKPRIVNWRNAEEYRDSWKKWLK